MSERVVSASWVADRADEVRVVDVRDAWEFDGIGHVPGAVNVPFDRFRADAHAAEASDGTVDGDSDGADGGSDDGESDGDGADGGERGMLPGEDVFADLMSEAGITREDHVVAYDDTHGVFAARFLVTALLYGHPEERLHLLDGDFSAWRLDHETTSEVPDVEQTDYEIDRPDETPLVSMAEVETAVEGDAVVVDTREEWEYEEGHIPGAVRLDWRELVDEETRGLKPREEMEAILDDRGIHREDRIVLYCNTARRISHTYWVLRHLGFERVDFYEGSLTEWKAAGLELATGT
ncbi:MAG: sulfurtransferase [Haloarculaceae archaeon]